MQLKKATCSVCNTPGQAIKNLMAKPVTVWCTKCNKEQPMLANSAK